MVKPSNSPIESYIAKYALECPEKTAVIAGNERCTYRELKERVDGRAAEFRTTPLPLVVCVRAVPTIDYLVTYFALHTIGRCVAPLEKDIPQDAFQQISDNLNSHSGELPRSADILYTTGTTGKSKGVIISSEAIIADTENLIDAQGFTHALNFVISGPLNHIGSLSKIWPVIMLGATLIIVDGLRDINKFFGAFDGAEGAKFATFLVPASIRILLQFSADRLAALADRIDFIETGAAAISQADMEALCQLLPHSRLYNTYASTETGIIATYNFNEWQTAARPADAFCQRDETGLKPQTATLKHPTPGCLGKPMRHSQVFITEKGLIACKGKTLMSGYLGDPERTATVLREGTVYTSDMGFIDADGLLHLKGREDDVINVGGFKVAPTEVENAALDFPAVKDCVCIAVPHKITGQALKLLVVTGDGQLLEKRSLALHLKSRLETYKVPLLYEQVDAVRRTFNGKIDRKYYKG